MALGEGSFEVDLPQKRASGRVGYSLRIENNGILVPGSFSPNQRLWVSSPYLLNSCLHNMAFRGADEHCISSDATRFATCSWGQTCSSKSDQESEIMDLSAGAVLLESPALVNCCKKRAEATSYHLMRSS